MAIRDLDAERDKIQRQIEALERSLGPDVSSIDVILSGSSDDSDDEDSDSADGLDEDIEADEIVLEDGGNRAEMCLQMNLVYQAVIQEKLQELELLLSQNKVQQEELLWELAGRRTERAGNVKPYPANLSIGHFSKPYFKDKVTGVGPPANPEMIERSSHIVKNFKELCCKKWRTNDKEELRKAVLSDGLQRMIQPKLFKLEYLQQKRDAAKSDIDKKILTKQIQEVEREIDDVNRLPEETLLGKRTDDHDWEKISNVNFEGIHSADRISKIWMNHLHPDINNQPWKEDENKKLQEIAEKHNFVNWELIAEELATNRTAFQCLQQYQLHNKDFKRKEFTKEEDEMLMQFVQRMRVGLHIPYRKISYFMEGRDSMQLLHRWSKCLDPSLKKGHWSKEEDERLLKAVEKYGEKDWYKIRLEVPGRTDIQCRERYCKGLHKDIKKGKWTREEEDKLVELTKKYGVGHWAKVGRELTHRTGSQCLSKWKYISGYFKGRIRKRKRPEKKVRKTAPEKVPQNTAPQRRPRKSTPKKIKIEELSEDDVTDNSSESSSSITTSSSSSSSGSSSSSSSGSSSSSEDEDDSSNMEEEFNSKERRAATKFLESAPNLDLWIPRKQSSDLIQKITKKSATSFRVPQTKMRGRRGRYQLNTILKGIAYPPSTDTITENPKDILLEAKKSGHHILQISEDEVRDILRWNTILCQGKQGQQLSQKETNQEGDTSNTLRVARTKDKVPLDRSLLAAVTPWVGNVFLPILTRYTSPWDKQIHADVMRKKLSTVALTSTPIFTLLIQFFRIDVNGCLQVIQLRKTKASGPLQTGRRTAQQSKPVNTLSPRSILLHSLTPQKPQSKSTEKKPSKEPKPSRKRSLPQDQVKIATPAPKLKTVSELLKEKRMQQCRARRLAQNAALASPRILLSPQIVVNQAYMTTGQHQAPVQPVASTTSQNGPLQTMPLMSLPTCQVITTNNIVSGQISSPNSNTINRSGADAPKTVAPVQAAETTNPCNRVPSVGSPATVQAAPGARGMTSPQVPIQLLQSPLNPAVNPTTWILTPQGLIQIPVQAFFPSPMRVTVHQNLPVSESSRQKRIEPATGTASSDKAPETPTSTSSTANQQPPQSDGSSSIENTAGEASQAHCVQPAVQLTLTPKQYPVVKIAKVLTSSTLTAGPLNETDCQTSAPCPTTPQTPTSSTEKKILDLSLISLEDESNVKAWLQGTNNEKTPRRSMAYMPPSACTLKTFSRILSEKKNLETSAFKLVTRSDEEEDSNRKQEILDNLVEEKLKDNPAYNLLKKRFLSAFTFTGLLAAFTPPPSKTARPGMKSEDREEDRAINMDMYGGYDGPSGDNDPQSHPNQGETMNLDSPQTPMGAANNTGRRCRRKPMYHRSET
ncbi:snRNA-activating protein complex subunit 4 isoform X2 [Dendropsophus ebraccatus]|uniref:snRNA-activating protein complex subunit 4 isoform X2 n=1 Tax=Dendropsophus ebraccatus TaxID=150705 RepID=UPI003831B617